MMTDSTDKRARWLYLAGGAAICGSLLLFVGLLGAKQSNLHRDAEARAVAVEAGPRVLTVPVTRSTSDRTITVLGEAHPYATVTLYAKVSGYLREVRVDKGDRVEANQTLAVIESPETDRQYQAAVADARYKRSNARRAQALIEQGVVSAQEAEQAETEAAVAEAQEAALGTQKSYEILRAPFAGVVTARYADAGALMQNASSAQTSALPVVTVSQVDRLRIYAYLDQRDATFARVGDRAKITADARPDLELTAKVSRLTGELDPKTRTLLVEVDCDNRDHQILPGSFVHVALQIHTPSYLEIPAEALLLRREKPFVALVDPEGRVRFRPVTIAGDDGETVRIASGLSEGEAVALNLGRSVADGDRVRAVSATPTAKSADATSVRVPPHAS